jgi:hypothetical protein
MTADEIRRGMELWFWPRGRTGSLMNCVVDDPPFTLTGAVWFEPVLYPDHPDWSDTYGADPEDCYPTREAALVPLCHGCRRRNTGTDPYYCAGCKEEARLKREQTGNGV